MTTPRRVQQYYVAIHSSNPILKNFMEIHMVILDATHQIIRVVVICPQVTLQKTSLVTKKTLRALSVS